MRYWDGLLCAAGGCGLQVEVDRKRENPACAEAVPEEGPDGGSEGVGCQPLSSLCFWIFVTLAGMGMEKLEEGLTPTTPSTSSPNVATLPA